MVVRAAATAVLLAALQASASSFRTAFESGVSTSGSGWKTVNRPVRVTGVGFFDRLHNQTGMAPSGIELHPVLDIQFDPASGRSRVAPSAPGGAS